MRVNNNMIADQMLFNIQSTSEKLGRLQTSLSSGKKFERPSDDPVNVNRVMRLTEQTNKEKQYLTSLQTMAPVLQMTDSSLQDISGLVSNAQVQIKQAQNATNSDSMAQIAGNLDQIISTILTAANTTYNGHYLFGGFNVNEKPFVLENEKIRYNGTDDVVSVQVTDTDTSDLGIKGNDLFVTHSVQGNFISNTKEYLLPGLTTNSFNLTVGSNNPVTISVGTGTGDVTLQKVADAINSSGAEVKAYIKSTTGGYKLKLVSNFVGNDGEITIQDSVAGGVMEKLGMIDNASNIVGEQSDINNSLLDNLMVIRDKINAGDTGFDTEATLVQSGFKNVLRNLGRIGVMTQSVENRQQMMSDIAIKREELLASVQDIDYAQVAMQLNKEMMAYQAAIQSGAKVVMPSLLDYLR